MKGPAPRCLDSPHRQNNRSLRPESQLPESHPRLRFKYRQYAETLGYEPWQGIVNDTLFRPLTNVSTPFIRCAHFKRILPRTITSIQTF